MLAIRDLKASNMNQFLGQSLSIVITSLALNTQLSMPTGVARSSYSSMLMIIVT
ncbi:MULTISPECIES: hypothetical protein [Rhizobium]|uniref:Uncharacterized protein n=1 Tax=Rhizobium indicum TaxID=2583231 RepID=A0ABX6PNL2_9HYPH|nr:MULTISPECIES: hypothetical protein [Rhizobium]NNU69533.1 hypothetical protein [Rhizobium sp. WYCCWR 11152]QKK20264.1 hypothetical protein FFM53_027950 [Rhizobium indicum]QKK33070.1 hypothetical protein FE844_026000 [Rhizobium indicum]